MSKKSKGVGLIFGGLLIILAGHGAWKRGWDFKYNLPVPRFLWIPCTIVGALFIFVGLKNIMKKGKDPDEYLICVKCQNMVQVYKAPDGKCPKCGGDLEILKGFYERHPELKLNTKIHKHQNKD